MRVRIVAACQAAIGAKAVAHLIEAAGIDQLVLVDVLRTIGYKL